MGVGYWLNPETGMCVQIDTTHDAWVRVKDNADRIGLSESCHKRIMEYPETAIDEIRLAALHGGLVRIREHRWYLSVQFAAQSEQVKPVLEAVFAALVGLKIHPDTRLVIDNMLLNDSTAIPLGVLQSRLRKGQPVLPEHGVKTDGLP
jgi:hypothetical protein